MNNKLLCTMWINDATLVLLKHSFNSLNLGDSAINEKNHLDQDWERLDG